MQKNNHGSNFDVLRLDMYQFDNIRHHIPHIHVKHGNEWAVLNIPEGNIIEGNLKKEKLKLVQAWMLIHNEDLLTDWELAKTGQTIFKIEPLR